MSIRKHEIPILEYDDNLSAVLMTEHEKLNLKLPEKAAFAFKMIIPTMEWEKELQSFRQEFIDADSEMDGCLSLKRLENIAEWISQIERCANVENCSANFVPSTQFIYVREEDKKIIGVLQIRHYCNEYLRKYSGHIGYSVCPSERRKGYAKQMLACALTYCRKLGIYDVSVTCLEDNEASRRTILANGGEYESTVELPEGVGRLERYWIHQKPEPVGDKIIILGCSGSGKSTFAVKLNEITQMPLFHLDNIYWNPDRSHLCNDEFDLKVEQILKGDRWIVDGNYPRTYETRIKACDTIIFLDYDRDVCISGITERVGKKHPDMPWTEEKLDQELIDIVERFETEKRPGLMRLFEKYPDKQKIIFMNREQAERWLSEISTG